MNKFEQLIEYVINDEEAKARELFHDIVVEKSRAIYEEMMQDIDEESTHDEDEKAERAGRRVTKDIEYDDAKDRTDETMGGDEVDNMISDIEMDEQGIGEAEEDEMDMSLDVEDDVEMSDDDDHHADVGGDEELEDRVVDLEDKLDELMAEFEELMGQDSDDDSEEDIEVDMDSEEVIDDEMETESYRQSMEENVQLKAAPAPVKSEDGSVNKKAVYAVDSGARGAVAKPSNLDQGGEAQGRTAPTAKEAIGRVGNTPAQSTQQPAPATKPHLAQATGVNTKSVIQ